MISTTSNRIERAFLPLPLRRLQPPEHAPEASGPASPPPDERTRLLRALEQHRWNIGHTAAALGISRTTLWRRMRRLEIGEPSFARA
jgi:transcriptional regulator of acetoin/glycerol metabolism